MSERPRLDAVVFDAGGTLVRVDFEWIAELLGTLGYATDAATVRRAEVSGRRAYDASQGRSGGEKPPLGTIGDIHAYYGGMLRAAGVPEALIATCIERSRCASGQRLWSRPMEGARAMLDTLTAGPAHRRGFHSDGRAEEHLRSRDVLRGIEFVVDSELVGIEPDPGIFRIALDRLGVTPAHAIYVGDTRSVDEAGARAAGMSFVLIDPYGDYAAPGANAIRTIGELPAWLERHFMYHVNDASARRGGPA